MKLFISLPCHTGSRRPSGIEVSDADYGAVKPGEGRESVDDENALDVRRLHTPLKISKRFLRRNFSVLELDSAPPKYEDAD
ncbi:hypothetical protein TNCV_4412351 [Trichonephila clavipes]|nr:hypothetical protein TNCV_4412351 [Trichonephila clavipes]